MAHYFKAYKYAHGTWLSRSLYDIDRLSNELLLFLNTTQLWSFAPCYSRLIAPWGTALYPGVVCDRDSTILQCTSCYLARLFLSAATCRWHNKYVAGVVVECSLFLSVPLCDHILATVHLSRTGRWRPSYVDVVSQWCQVSLSVPWHCCCSVLSMALSGVTHCLLVFS